MTKNTFALKNPLPLDKYLNLRYLFALAIILTITLNTADLIKETYKIEKQRESIPFYFSGFKFLGLEDIFRGVSHAGYYTDKDLSVKQNAAQFAEAQYILAPTILDFNNTDREFILFDCTTEEKALEKIRQIRAIPLKKNEHGIILARKIK